MTKKKAAKAVRKTQPAAVVAPFRPETRADFIAHPEFALILRTCRADRSSRNGFVWPESGMAECPDWKATVACGNGLHGLLWGEGSGGMVDWSESAKWLVVLVRSEDVIQIDSEKCKFPRGEVMFCGDRIGAVTYMQDRRPDPSRSGVSGTATAGDRGTATAGYRGTATAGDSGTATAGDRGTATAGYSGTATAGYRGTATAGDRGTATAGDRGTATAGEDGVIAIRWWDSTKGRYRVALGYVGEGGIKPNVKYRASETGVLVEVAPEVTR